MIFRTFDQPPTPKPRPAPKPKPPVTQEEKKVLLSQVTKIMTVLGEKREEEILNIIMTSNNLSAEDETIEVDLDTLNDETLRKLQT